MLFVQAVMEDPLFRERMTRIFQVSGQEGGPPPELSCRSS